MTTTSVTSISAPLEVCCVLNGNWPTGKDDGLGERYVKVLYESLARHAPPELNWRFTCFSDRQLPKSRPLPSNLWTWFSKLYAFSPDAFPLNSRVLYFDLDTVIVGNWEPLTNVNLSKMACLGDVMPGTNGRVPVPASGIMSWIVTPDTQCIWNELEPYSKKRPPYPSRCTPREARTDEQWMYQFLLPREEGNKHIPASWEPWERLIPGRLASWKNKLARESRFVRQARGDEPIDWGDICAVYFHGRPRPHEVKAVWNPWNV